MKTPSKYCKHLNIGPYYVLEVISRDNWCGKWTADQIFVILIYHTSDNYEMKIFRSKTNVISKMGLACLVQLTSLNIICMNILCVADFI